ncbi:MAG: hypothetical protein D6B27_05095 [Gammaproteobacteria bacterium]|nr:MAG: hypothetical protein D6B27_05095 [Gammaproteobacteria bacterium]
MLNVTKGVLIEYALSIPPLVLGFDFNPKTLTRTRTITIKKTNVPGRGGYDFVLPTETPKVAQGVSVEPESFSIDILIDATDRLEKGDVIAEQFGIEPELDTLRTMVEPKESGPMGMQVLSGLGFGGNRAFQRNQSASVILFIWGSHVLPVFLTSITVEQTDHFPNLVPYRAKVSLSMKVIEGNNIFYKAEKIRQVIGAALNLGAEIGSVF